MHTATALLLCTIFFNGEPTLLYGRFPSYETARAAFFDVIKGARAQAGEEDVFEMRCTAEGV